MCIPPINEEPSMHFSLLKKIASRNKLSELSMGMSSDYEDAIKFGATSVRIGSLFLVKEKLTIEYMTRFTRFCFKIFSIKFIGSNFYRYSFYLH